MWLRHLHDATVTSMTDHDLHDLLSAFFSSRLASCSPISHRSGSTRLNKRSLRLELAVSTCTGGLEGATEGGGGRGEKASGARAVVGRWWG